MPTNTYQDLRSVNVNDHIEKKNNLSYLSWAWAVDTLLQRDPTATWEYKFGVDPDTKEQVPYVCIGRTAMVFCTVKAFGVERTAQLPVMNHRNQPIEDPDSFQVNTAMQRCLAKAIALHGLGLYIYAGEDIPSEANESQGRATNKKPEAKVTAEEIETAKALLQKAKTVDDLRSIYMSLNGHLKVALDEYAKALAKSLE